MKSLLIILLSLTLIDFSAKNEKATIKIVIPKNYFGWGYLVGAVKNENENIKEGKYYLNEKGVAYIDTAIINNDFEVEFYKNNKKLSETEVKFLFTTEDPSINRRIFLFYVLNEEEVSKGDEFWEDEDNRRPIKQKQYFHKGRLIKEGIIKAK